MTASERIRAARTVKVDRENQAKALAKYGIPAYCGCLRCRIIRFSKD